MNTARNVRSVCIYARVSTAEQEKEGFSIPAQLKMLRTYAIRHGFHVAQEYVDTETARCTGRTGFNAMIAFMDAHRECRVILVEKTDRLTRNMADYLALDIEKTGIQIHFVRENKIMSRDSSPSDHFIQDIEIAQAAYLSRNISAEARKGMRAKAEAGLYPSKAPLGYLNTVDARGVRVMVPDPERAPLVKLAFEKYAEGNVSINRLASELFILGLRTKKGRRVSLSTLHKMLGNPIYKGKFIWNGIEYEGKHEPLVSCSLWYSVQDSCEKRCVEKPKQTAEFAYTGLMKCGNCGCAITAERKKDKYNYYHCTGYKGWHYKEPVVREEKLDAQFSSLLKGLEIEEGIARIILEWLAAETRDERKTLEETRERLATQRRSLQRRSEVLYDDRLDGRITVTRFDEKDAEIKRELELVEEKLESLESSSPVDPLESARGILELSQNAHRLFVKAPADEKKQFLQNMLSNCTLQAGSIRPELRQPFDMLYDTNAVWKASGAVSSNREAVHTVWRPQRDSNPCYRRERPVS